MKIHKIQSPDQDYTVFARIDRLPASSRYLMGLIARIAAGGWFEFFELFMPGFISLGLVRAGIFTLTNKGLLDTHSFASFLASFFLGMFLSTCLFGFISDSFGRRSIFIWSMVVYSAAQFMVGVLSNSALIDLARLIAGFAVGMQLINNDSYISELTPRASRGRYMTTSFIFVLSAIPGAALLAALLVPHDPFGIAGWRYVVLFGSASGLIIWFLQRGLPESPRWLEAHGRLAEADAVVTEIENHIMREHGKPLPPPDRNNVPEVVQDSARWQEMFGAFYFQRTLIISIFQFAQTIAVFGFTAFVPVLLMKHGISVVHSLNYTLMIVLLAPVGATCGAYFSERIERKWQLVFTACLISGAGAVFALGTSVPVIVCAGALIALGNNWMISVFHPYAAELFPTRIRARALGFTFSWSRVSSIFVGYWVGDLLAAYGAKAVFIMIGAAMLSIIIGIGVFGPKTNGQALETLSP
jgi:putative MFS transporter